jgi:molybdenum cofactor biosynthesis enzyme MoaA
MDVAFTASVLAAGSHCEVEAITIAPRRALRFKNVQRLVDEAVELGFSGIFFTSSEPFVLKDIAGNNAASV